MQKDGEQDGQDAPNQITSQGQPGAKLLASNLRIICYFAADS